MKSIAEKGVILYPKRTKLINPTANHRRKTRPIAKPRLLKRSPIDSVKYRIKTLYINTTGLWKINTNGLRRERLPSISRRTASKIATTRIISSHFHIDSSYDVLIILPVLAFILTNFSFMKSALKY